MGIFSQMGGGLGDIYGAFQDIKRGSQDQTAAEEAEAQYYADRDKMLAGFEERSKKPTTYAGDLVGPYQRTSSPVARAYLESMLTGDNADAASSPWANPDDRGAAQARSTKRYGELDNLLAQEKYDNAKTPWATKSPDYLENRRAAGERAGYVGAEIAPEEHELYVAGRSGGPTASESGYVAGTNQRSDYDSAAQKEKARREEEERAAKIPTTSTDKWFGRR